MLECIRFILKQVVNFCAMLFTIDVGEGYNLGILLCILFIFLPIVLRVIKFIRQDAIDELNDRYDESRPREYNNFHRTTTYNADTDKVTDLFHTTRGVRSTRRRRKGSGF